jgi:hypothetical protein
MICCEYFSLHRRAEQIVWTRAAGGVSLNLHGAAKGALIRAAASTQSLCG